MPNKYYYHVTTKDKLDAIMKEGLKPTIGKNSASVNEDEPAIYLSNRRDIPYWSILLRTDTVLKIDSRGIDLDEWSWTYDNYEEFRTHKPISPQWITKSSRPNKAESFAAMRDLAKSYIYTLSYMCFAAIRTEWSWLNDDLSAEGETRVIEAAKTIAGDITANLEIMSYIDFGTITQREIARVVRKHSNDACYITFADSYFSKDSDPDVPDAGKRCWQHLANIEMEEMKDACLELHKFIKKVIPPYVRRLPGIGGFAM